MWCLTVVLPWLRLWLPLILLDWELWSLGANPSRGALQRTASCEGSGLALSSH